MHMAGPARTHHRESNTHDTLQRRLQGVQPLEVSLPSFEVTSGYIADRPGYYELPAPYYGSVRFSRMWLAFTWLALY